MKLEEYIAYRKKEDGVNEFSIEERAENTKTCVNYVFEFFNNYLDSIGGTEETILHNQKIDKYRDIIKDYSPDVREWLIQTYAMHGKYMHRNLGNMISDTYFLLYDSEREFRALSYDIYPKAVKRFPFLDGQSEMVYRFIKDYHRVKSSFGVREIDFTISPQIDDWISDTLKKSGVNILNFCINYVVEFYEEPDRWPKGHKMKSDYIDKYNLKPDDNLYWDYDYRQKNNLFGLDSLYREMPKKNSPIKRNSILK